MEFKPLPIIPLIQQHASDAAFYWQCVEDSLFSLSFDKDKVDDFRYLLNAHLDGLRAAGDIGRKEAFDNLETWRAEGEAFVCSVLAFESGDREQLNRVIDIVKQDPDAMLAGLISAVRLVGYDKIAADIDRWLASEESIYRHIAIEGYTGHNIELPEKTIRRLLADKDDEIKAAVCRHIGSCQLSHYLGELHTLFGNESLTVRGAASLAIIWIWPSSPVLFNQLFSVLKDYLVYSHENGLNDLALQKKLVFFTRLAGMVLPYGDLRLDSHLHSLPDYLKILFLAHHGDPGKLSYLMALMEQKKLAPLAFWGIAAIVGIDVDDDTFLLLDDDYEEEDDEPNDSDDDLISAVENLNAGQIRPNVDAVKWFLFTQHYDNKRLLLGQEPSPDYCRSLLANRDIPLIMQYSALWHLCRLEPDTRYNDVRFR